MNAIWGYVFWNVDTDPSFLEIFIFGYEDNGTLLPGPFWQVINVKLEIVYTKFEITGIIFWCWSALCYGSVPMDEEEKRAIDYSSDLLITDHNFRQSVLSKIALAGFEIEQLYKSPQDVEGVIKNGELYVVQTRPQM